ncbi:unnamed protein product, partial [Oppiella nova]
FKSKLHFDDVLRNVAKKYGPVFTVWLGNAPHVFVTDIDMAREAFKKNDIAGRTESFFGSQLSNDTSKDIVFTDYGHTWEALRRVAHSAVQKYSTNDRLAYVATDCVDRTVKTILDKEGVGKPFSPINYIYLTFLNILATSTFGQSYDLEDKEFKDLKYVLSDYVREVGARFVLWEFSPILRLLDKKRVNKMSKLFKDTAELMKHKYISHQKDYSESIERDFCDALITAKNEALSEGKESAPYLTDGNLAMTIFDLFFAGTDTSQQTFQWLLILLSYYPEMQRKLRQEIETQIGDRMPTHEDRNRCHYLRQEIETQIGDRMPTHEDRNRCHYVMAFITETLRFRNIVPQGLPHRAIVRTTIGKHTIPEDMAVIVYQGYICRNDKDWEKANEFIPERFLDKQGEFITTRPKAYIPFGVGRRVCPGEKLAIADLFLVLVRFLQSTQDYDIVLDSHNVFKSALHWDDVFRNVAKQYGPVFTIWFGNTPQLIVTDIDLAREAFRKNDIAGRPVSYFGSQLSNDKYSDIIMTDYGHKWEALRRVAHSAIQKYSTNDRLIDVATDCVDRTIKTILDKEGVGTPFSPIQYIYLMFLNILATSTFGQSYDMEDKEFKQIKYIIKDFNKEAGNHFLLWEFSPILRLLDHKLVKKQRLLFREAVDMMRTKFSSHYKDYSESIERDFCDALITAKNESLREGKESAPYLKDENLAMTIFDIFFAGTDTSQQTFQ